jgi:hypothetical protein
MDSLFGRVDEDEGSSLRGGANRAIISRENRRISGYPPSKPKLDILSLQKKSCDKPVR